MVGTRTRRETKGKTLFATGFFVAAFVAMIFMADPARAATFTVNSTGDAPDITSGDGVCDADASMFVIECTLRAAIAEANSTAGADTINFDIPDDPNVPGVEVKTIKPSSQLPAIFDPVTINGYSQDGASANTLAAGSNAVLKIELDGSGVQPQLGLNGLKLNASNSVIKGLVINRFEGTAVEIGFSGGNITGNEIEGNFIGADPSGALDRGNDEGVVIVGGFGANSSNTIGGATLAARNVISGNDNGILIGGPNNKVIGNYVGTKKNGIGALGNAFDGVAAVNSSGNMIGGSTPASANTIAFNGADGVAIVEITADATGNRILRNSIYSNGNLGIDLDNDGKTPNDKKDPDAGANDRQNFPVLASAKNSGGKTTVKGVLRSKPNRTFVIRFFSNPKGAKDEGKTFIGQKSVKTGANGKVSFVFKPAKKVKAGLFVTATATSQATGDTSEFSAQRKVAAT